MLQAEQGTAFVLGLVALAAGWQKAAPRLLRELESRDRHRTLLLTPGLYPGASPLLYEQIPQTSQATAKDTPLESKGIPNELL